MKPPSKKKSTVKKDGPVASKEMDIKHDNRPNMYISEKEVPGIKDWKIGQKYMVEVEVEMVGIRKQDGWDSDPGKIKGDFKINKITSDSDSDEETKNNFPEAMKKKK